MNDYKRIQFDLTIQKRGNLLKAVIADSREPVMSISYDGYYADAILHFDFDPRPLRLLASAQIGDAVSFRILPYRLELYINGELIDEEWPCGSHYLADAQFTGVPYTCSIPDTVKPDLPCVLGTFENAEGWKPDCRIQVGDCMPYAFEDRYHVLYLKDRRYCGSKWGLGAHQWAHISTTDFTTWQIHPMAIEIDDPAEGSICTGSWFYDKGIHYLYYTVRTCDQSPAWICRSISRDGYHFEKDRSFRTYLSDRFLAASGRDPKVMKTSDGLYHMFVTTTYMKTKCGCLAHLVSADMDTWEELDEPIVHSPNASEPECTDYFYYNGYYYLIYSLGSRARYQFSKDPLKDWQYPADEIIPCERVPKAAVWNDRIIFTGFDNLYHGYGGIMTFMEAWAEPDGELIFGPMTACGE